MPSIDICLSPDLFHLFPDKNSVVVVVDVLRATSSICGAFHSGVKEIIPVENLKLAREYKSKGFLVAAERDGARLDFADFGNSPRKFPPEEVKNQTIVFSSTNGTPTIKKAEHYKQALIGSFVNLEAIFHHLKDSNENVVVLCSGWKGNFSMEDMLFGGALAEKLIATKNYKITTDIVDAAVQLWQKAKDNLHAFLDHAEHVHRLKKLGAHEDIRFCLQLHNYPEIPVYKNGKLTKLLD